MMTLNTYAPCAAFLLCFEFTLFFPTAGIAEEQQVQCFPQFADGAGYTTSWYFTGYGFGTSTIDVEIFNKDGQPQTLATDKGTDSIFHLSLTGYGSATLRTLGAGPLKSGWVRITSSPAVGATETFKFADSSGFGSQASVFPTAAIASATLLVPDPRNTAIAVSTVNSNALNFRLVDRDGNTVGTASNYPLPAHRQVALFVNQIPGFEGLNVMDGSIEVSGSATFFLTTLVFGSQNFATAPVLSGRYAPAGVRSSLLNQFGILQRQTKDIGDQLLPPSSDDLTSFSAFLSQPQTGLMRLLPRETYDGYLTVRGGGSYYSFARQAHEYGYGSDLSLEQGYLSVGFAGVDFGFLTSLGDVPIDSVGLNTPAVQYMASFSAPTNETDARAQFARAGAGFSVGGFQYISRLKAAASATFAVRSINYDTSDVLVAFRLVRIDADGSAIIVWKILQTFDVPKLQ